MGIAESAKYHKGVLQMQDNFQEADMANSRINPTIRTIRYWYDQWRFLHLGPRNGSDMIAKLKEKILTYQEQGSVLQFNEEPFAVSIVTKLMRRASNLETAADIVFVDSTSSCDAENHSITFFLTPCAAGAVPLGIVITKGQTEIAYTAGFELLKNSLGKPFNRNDSTTIFMTDNSSAEINSLSSIWPGCENLLCIFHVEQAVWRWLWDSKHCILKEHRAILMSHFQRILYASRSEEAANEYLNAQGCIGAYLPIYENWIEYLSQQWTNRKKWCLAFRDKRVRGHHTNNFSEISVRIFNDSSEVVTNEDESLQTVETKKIEIPDLDCPSDEKTDDLFGKIIKLQEDLHNRFRSSSSGLEKFYSKLNKISSEGQWEEFLHTAGNRIPLRHRAGASIRVQPTSIARRSLKVTRGSKRLLSGRPASGVSVKRKRSHSLSTNIKLNQPNAKMHGHGH